MNTITIKQRTVLVERTTIPEIRWFMGTKELKSKRFPGLDEYPWLYRYYPQMNDLIIGSHNAWGSFYEPDDPNIAVFPQQILIKAKVMIGFEQPKGTLFQNPNRVERHCTGEIPFDLEDYFKERDINPASVIGLSYFISGIVIKDDIDNPITVCGAWFNRQETSVESLVQYHNMDFLVHAL